MLKQTIQISSGPSREELFDGLRLFAEKRTTSFVIKDNGRLVTLPVVMRVIGAEDGGGESWNIEFNVLTRRLLELSLLVELKELIKNNSSIHTKAYYSTKRRTGVIILEYK